MRTTTSSLATALTLALAMTFILGCDKDCNGEKYDPKTNFCANNAIISKCGDKEYDTEAQICIEDKVLQKCGDKGYDSATQFCDARDGKAYKYAKIGEQVWMAENLNHEMEGGKCYGEGWKAETDERDEKGYKARTLTAEEAQANCEKYGRLYNWEAAMKSCPEGWHLPSLPELEILIEFAGGGNDAGNKLKAKDGWKDHSENMSGNGTDDYGFAALPSGGWTSYDSLYKGAGKNGEWWYATDKDFAYAYYYSISTYKVLSYSGTHRKSNINSVRCVQNSPTAYAAFEKCGDEEYDPYSKFCVDNAVYYKCNGETYNPVTQFCSQSYIIRDKCNGQEYNYDYGQSGQDCRDGKVVTLCDYQPFDPETQGCCNINDGGSVVYDIKTQECGSDDDGQGMVIAK